MEKEVLRWWKGSMAEGAVVGWAWEWMDLDADAREGPRGRAVSGAHHMFWWKKN